MPATISPRPCVLALGVLLPLAIVGGASAQQQAAPRSGWIDPPARPAAAAPQSPAPEPARAAEGQEQGQANEPVRQAAKPEPADDALPPGAPTRAAGPRRAAALERSHGHENLRRHAAPARRLADTPAAQSPAAPTGRSAVARALVAQYLATVSASGDAMVGAAPHFYATRVHFYGHPISLAGLVAEKRNFVQRWPERRYAPRSIRTACDSETCTIRTIVDFRTANPDRGAVSTGAAELILEVRFSGTRPVIVGETGRVLHRNVQAGTLAPSPGKA